MTGSLRKEPPNGIDLSGLNFVRCRFVLLCTSPLEVAPMVGATLRGDFGATLHAMTCAEGAAAAPAPVVAQNCTCAYCQLYGATGSAAVSQPRPYIFEPLDFGKTQYGAGEELHFNLTLIGHATELLDVCIDTWQQLGRRGMGRNYLDGAGRFRVVRVNVETAAGVVDVLPETALKAPRRLPPLGVDAILQRAQALSGQQLSMHLLSPTEIRQAGRPLDSFEFHHVWDALVGRLSNLTEHYCDTPLQADFKALKARALAVRKIDDTLHWSRQIRRSRRQHEDVAMSGLLGHMRFEGDLTPFLPALVAGEWLHVGKGCVMGNGAYRLHSAEAAMENDETELHRRR